MIARISLFFICFLTSCRSPTPETRFEAERSKVIVQVLRNYTAAMAEKNLVAGGVGEGLNHSNGKYNYLGVTFIIENLPNIEIARSLIVEAIQEFLGVINSQEKIQDYIDEYPASLNLIRISILSQQDENGLSSVSSFRNQLIYRKLNPEDLEGTSLEIHRESFSEAVRILSE